MALFNPAYTQFINQRVPQTQQQPQQRQIGFGNNFKDTPPTFITETKEDNKIERLKKPKPKKTKRKKKKKN